MAENSKIEWTDHTWNPWVGCTKISPACDNCYAEGWSKRAGRDVWGPHVDRQRTKTQHDPIKWNKQLEGTGRRERVFVASLADVFDNHKSIQLQWRRQMWHIIEQCTNLDFLLLTKRPQNIARYLPSPQKYGLTDWGNGWPNVWLGTTVENQAEANKRIRHLLDVPASIRFLSCEPLLGPLRLDQIARGGGSGVYYDDCLTGFRSNGCGGYTQFAGKQNPHIHWVICGGESGHGARPSHPDWYRSLRDQCEAAGVAFHFKQWGDWHPFGEKLHDGVTNLFSKGKRPSHWYEWPDPEISVRVGKKKAGRLLDGVEHNAAPGV